MYRIIALFICFYCFSASLVAEENPSLLYISQYKEIAIAEMERSGIPASIKMAQALLESGAGRSTLAKEANNHFGIKCGGEWSGKTFYRKDDDYNAKGELIKSCFRKFKSADGSFAAHSDFLMYQKRYAFLFSYDASDYHNWAHGLKKAGYATDKSYPDKLINLIEKYELFLLDREVSIIAENNAESVIKTKKNRTKGKQQNNQSRSSSSAEVVYIESNSENKKEASRRTNTRKKSRSNSSSSKNLSSNIYHIIKDNESIAQVAKRYGVKENGLRIRNRLPKNAEPLAGEKIYIRKKIRLLEQPQYTKAVASRRSTSNDKYIF